MKNIIIQNKFSKSLRCEISLAEIILPQPLVGLSLYVFPDYEKDVLNVMEYYKEDEFAKVKITHVASIKKVPKGFETMRDGQIYQLQIEGEVHQRYTTEVYEKYLESEGAS